MPALLTSFSKILPFGPVPTTFSILTFSSLASFLTEGVASMLILAPCFSIFCEAAALSSAAVTCSCIALFIGALFLGSATSASPISAITSPILTILPSFAIILSFPGYENYYVPNEKKISIALDDLMK